MSLPENPIPSSMETVEAPASMSASRAAWYVGGLVLLLLVTGVVGLYITTTPWFMHRDHYEGLRNFGYSRRVGSPNCDIVLWGDSSALTGLNPRVFERITGLTACNISEGTTIQSVVGSDDALRYYLDHNKAPRFLLSMWTPSDFHPDRPRGFASYPEGMTYVAQFENHPRMWWMMARKLRWLPKQSAWALTSVADDELTRLEGKQKNFDAQRYRDERLGWFPYPEPPETHCVRGAMKPGEIIRWADSVAAFRKKYSTPQTTVIVNLSADPDCDPSYDEYASTLQGLYDNKFERLPIGLYNNGDVHYTPEGAEYISSQAAKQIVALMQQQAAEGAKK